MSIGLTAFAPCRVDLSAGFPDVAPFSDRTEGLIVNAGLREGVRAVYGGRRDDADGFPRLILRQACRQSAIEPESLSVVLTHPAGSGLGVSGATSVAIAASLMARRGIPLTPTAVAELGWTYERDIGLAGGTQDQLASAHGGVGLVHTSADHSFRTPLEVDMSWLEERLVLVHAGRSRSSGAIIRAVRQRAFEPRARAIVESMSAVARELVMALQGRDEAGLITCVSHTRRLQADLHPLIVDADTDALLQSAGVQAAKPCGAGGPGAAWLCTMPPDQRPALTENIVKSGLHVLKMSLSGQGVQVREGEGRA